MSEVYTTAAGARYLVAVDHDPMEIVELADLFNPRLAGLLFIGSMMNRTRLNVFGEYFPFHKVCVFAKNMHHQLGLEKSIDEVAATYILMSQKEGTFYVGSSGEICQRIYSHRKKIRNGTHHARQLVSAFAKHGEADLRVIVLHCSDREKAYRLEQRIVDAFSSDEKMLNRGVVDVKLPQLGIKQSPELLNKLSLIRKKQWSDPARRQKMSAIKKSEFANDPSKREARRTHMLQHFSDPGMRLKQADMMRQEFNKGDRRQRQSESTKAAFADPEIRQKYIDAARERTGSKQLSIEGVLYEGYNDASRRLGLQAALIRYRVLSPKPQWSEWRFA